jgi:glutamine amidotransferase
VIALIDYGAGNLASVRKALAVLGAEIVTPRTAGDLDDADGIVVPGVGHFSATAALDRAWRASISAAIDRGAAVLGICLGMQWLFDGSEEAPCLSGLGIFRGNCVHLAGASGPSRPSGPSRTATRPTSPTRPTRPTRLKVPHVGWNSVEMPRASVLMRGVPSPSHVYFTHSYVAPVVQDAAALTTYGSDFSAAVERGRIAGVQFHPEKSGDVGLRILNNWLDAV